VRRVCVSCVGTFCVEYWYCAARIVYWVREVCAEVGGVVPVFSKTTTATVLQLPPVLLVGTESIPRLTLLGFRFVRASPRFCLARTKPTFCFAGTNALVWMASPHERQLRPSLLHISHSSCGCDFLLSWTSRPSGLFSGFC
jgi:hypothetical protein